MLLSTMQSINEQLGATILMVTHDAFSASYAGRILFLRDGAIFTEILKGNDSSRVFFEKILDVLSMLGGGQRDVRYGYKVYTYIGAVGFRFGVLIPCVLIAAILICYYGVTIYTVKRNLIRILDNIL